VSLTLSTLPSFTNRHENEVFAVGTGKGEILTINTSLNLLTEEVIAGIDELIVLQGGNPVVGAVEDVKVINELGNLKLDEIVDGIDEHIAVSSNINAVNTSILGSAIETNSKLDALNASNTTDSLNLETSNHNDHLVEKAVLDSIFDIELLSLQHLQEINTDLDTVNVSLGESNVLRTDANSTLNDSLAELRNIFNEVFTTNATLRDNEFARDADSDVEQALLQAIETSNNTFRDTVSTVVKQDELIAGNQSNFDRAYARMLIDTNQLSSIKDRVGTLQSVVSTEVKQDEMISAINGITLDTNLLATAAKQDVVRDVLLGINTATSGTNAGVTQLGTQLLTVAKEAKQDNLIADNQSNFDRMNTRMVTDTNQFSLIKDGINQQTPLITEINNKVSTEVKQDEMIAAINGITLDNSLTSTAAKQDLMNLNLNQINSTTTDVGSRVTQLQTQLLSVAKEAKQDATISAVFSVNNNVNIGNSKLDNISGDIGNNPLLSSVQEYTRQAADNTSALVIASSADVQQQSRIEGLLTNIDLELDNVTAGFVGKATENKQDVELNWLSNIYYRLVDTVARLDSLEANQGFKVVSHDEALITYVGGDPVKTIYKLAGNVVGTLVQTFVDGNVTSYKYV